MNSQTGRKPMNNEKEVGKEKERENIKNKKEKKKKKKNQIWLIYTIENTGTRSW